MYKYSLTSITNLSTCSPGLQAVFNEVIKRVDCSILCGYRSKAAQDEAYINGNSMLKWPESRHNSFPSHAVDVAPYPINWSDAGRFRVFAGRVLQIAAQLEVNLRWGGDWDGDTQTTDQNFNDLVHFEEIIDD